ncbi:hypothetical protein [Trichormus variabilis]|uniref:hypothetical protein n=1 Tax=Anabaena variabilis TaxID=264691 RepID=UPI0016869FAB|nr:hypothetical protein [Trichormus variabilis]MBD2625627.1 hypothetical protein [Trichormus variabilis FACHB-164]
MLITLRREAKAKGNHLQYHLGRTKYKLLWQSKCLSTSEPLGDSSNQSGILTGRTDKILVPPQDYQRLWVKLGHQTLQLFLGS